MENKNYFKIEANNCQIENHYTSQDEIIDLMFTGEIEDADKKFSKENKPLIVEYKYNEKLKKYEAVSFLAFYVTFFGTQQFSEEKTRELALKNFSD